MIKTPLVKLTKDEAYDDVSADPSRSAQLPIILVILVEERLPPLVTILLVHFC